MHALSPLMNLDDSDKKDGAAISSLTMAPVSQATSGQKTAATTAMNAPQAPFTDEDSS